MNDNIELYMGSQNNYGEDDQMPLDEYFYLRSELQEDIEHAVTLLTVSDMKCEETIKKQIKEGDFKKLCLGMRESCSNNNEYSEKAIAKRQEGSSKLIERIDNTNRYKSYIKEDQPDKFISPYAELLPISQPLDEPLQPSTYISSHYLILAFAYYIIEAANKNDKDEELISIIYNLGKIPAWKGRFYDWVNYFDEKQPPMSDRQIGKIRFISTSYSIIGPLSILLLFRDMESMPELSEKEFKRVMRNSLYTKKRLKGNKTLLEEIREFREKNEELKDVAEYSIHEAYLAILSLIKENVIIDAVKEFEKITDDTMFAIYKVQNENAQKIKNRILNYVEMDDKPLENLLATNVLVKPDTTTQKLKDHYDNSVQELQQLLALIPASPFIQPDENILPCYFRNSFLFMICSREQKRKKEELDKTQDKFYKELIKYGEMLSEELPEIEDPFKTIAGIFWGVEQNSPCVWNFMSETLIAEMSDLLLPYNISGSSPASFAIGNYNPKPKGTNLLFAQTHQQPLKLKLNHDEYDENDGFEIKTISNNERQNSDENSEIIEVTTYVNLAQIIFNATGGVVVGETIKNILLEKERGFSHLDDTTRLIADIVWQAEKGKFSIMSLFRDNLMDDEKEPDEIMDSSDDLMETLKEKNKTLRSKNKELQVQIQELLNRVKELKKVQEDEEATAKELADLRTLVYNLSNKEKLDEEEKTPIDIQFPVHLSKKVAIFGGHDSWIVSMKKYIDNATFYGDRPRVPAEVFKNCDEVWIQTNCIGHPRYWYAIENAKLAGKPIRFFSGASPKLSAMQIINE